MSGLAIVIPGEALWFTLGALSMLGVLVFVSWRVSRGKEKPPASDNKAP